MRPFLSYQMKIIFNDLGYSYTLFWQNILYHMLNKFFFDNHVYFTGIVKYNVYQYTNIIFTILPI